MKNKKSIEFSELKKAYITVKTFLEKESLEKVPSLKTRIAEDLSLYGDDNYDLLTKFANKFEIEYSNFNYDERFHSEGEIFNSINFIFNVVIFLIRLPLIILEFLSNNRLKLDKPNYFGPKREVIDMTFRELLTSYIEGKYTAENIRYTIN